MKNQTPDAQVSTTDYSDRKGYRKDFISASAHLPLPDFTSVSNLLKPALLADRPFEIPYYNFSIILHKKRKFPLFTACNIDGTQIQDTKRKDSWRPDPRVKAFQWGNELYSAKKSDFDKGHMTRREDPAWGANEEIAFSADQDTFHYTNAVPQVHKLNAYTWKELEDHVLHYGAVAEGLRISVFTGPILDEHDNPFVTPIKEEQVLIPNKFWKVIVWNKENKGLHAVGFVMSQEKVLIDNGIVVKPKQKRVTTLAQGDDVFEHIRFKDRKSYQVPVSYIEKLTGIKFNWPQVTFPYSENKAIEIKRRKITRAQDYRASVIRKGKLNAYEIKNMML